jgi:enamine deaminase RidA (YjgF/YER057c/UK114 family)
MTARARASVSTFDTLIIFDSIAIPWENKLFCVTQVKPSCLNDPEQRMTHTRIRKFNTKATYPEQKLDNDLCQAVVARGSIVFVRGQVGQDLDTAVNVAIGDPVGQTDKAMTNIKTLLQEAGARLEDICKITIYITDPRYREPVYRKIGEHLKGVFPVSTGLVVSALARPEWLVEVDVTAVIPDNR